MRFTSAAEFIVVATLCEAKVSDYAHVWDQGSATRVSGAGNVFINGSPGVRETMLRGAAEGSSTVALNKVLIMRNPKTGFTIVSDHQGTKLKVSAGTTNSSDETSGLKQMMYKDDEEVDSAHEDWLNARMAENEARPEVMSRSTVGTSLADTRGAEVDSSGNIVIDYFCGFTKDAARYVDYNLFMACEFGAEAVNSALRDSGITNARLRVVGAQAFGESEDLDARWAGLNSPDLKETKDWVGPLGAKHGADIMTTWLLRDPEKGDTTIGKGYVPGRFNMVTIDHIGSVEHEIGHNFGLRHCPDPSKYPDGNTGYLVASLGYGTMMCGDEIPVWSSPKLKYGNHVLGDSKTDAVKYLQRALGTTSRAATAVYPLDDVVHYKKIMRSATVVLKRKGEMSDAFSFTITKDMDTVWITTNRGDIGYLYVQKDKAPTTSKYLDKSKYPVIHLSQPEPGTYYVGMVAREHGAENQPRVVDIWIPAEDGEEIDPSKPTVPPSPTLPPTPLTTTSGQDDKTGNVSIPAWDKDTVYSTPCTKVSYGGSVFLNGWYTRGETPDASNTYGVWRAADSPNAHSVCK